MAELPFRDVHVDAQVHDLMRERGESPDDIVRINEGCWARAADFRCGVLFTQRYMYVATLGDYEEPGTYSARCWAVELPKGGE